MTHNNTQHNSRPKAGPGQFEFVNFEYQYRIHLSKSEQINADPQPQYKKWLIYPEHAPFDFHIVSSEVLVEILNQAVARQVGLSFRNLLHGSITSI